MKEEATKLSKKQLSGEISMTTLVEDLMMLQGSPRQINKWLTKEQKPEFTNYYHYCMKVHAELSDPYFYCHP